MSFEDVIRRQLDLFEEECAEPDRDCDSRGARIRRRRPRRGRGEVRRLPGSRRDRHGPARGASRRLRLDHDRGRRRGLRGGVQPGGAGPACHGSRSESRTPDRPIGSRHVRTLRPGLWHWEAPHPQWESGAPWGPEVSSYAIDDGERLLFFDPIAPPSELEALAGRPRDGDRPHLSVARARLPGPRRAARLARLHAAARHRRVPDREMGPHRRAGRATAPPTWPGCSRRDRRGAPVCGG